MATLSAAPPRSRGLLRASGSILRSDYAGKSISLPTRTMTPVAPKTTLAPKVSRKPSGQSRAGRSRSSRRQILIASAAMRTLKHTSVTPSVRITPPPPSCELCVRGTLWATPAALAIVSLDGPCDRPRLPLFAARRCHSPRFRHPGETRLSVLRCVRPVIVCDAPATNRRGEHVIVTLSGSGSGAPVVSATDRTCALYRPSAMLHSLGGSDGRPWARLLPYARSSLFPSIRRLLSLKWNILCRRPDNLARISAQPRMGASAAVDVLSQP